MSANTDTDISKNAQCDPDEVLELNPGLKSAVLGLLLLKFRSSLSGANVLKVLAGAFVLAGLCYLSIPEGGVEELSSWLEMTFLSYLMPLVCLTVGGGAIRNEIKEFTIEYLWTRPLKRSQLLIGSFVGSLAFCVVLGWILGTVIFGVGLFRGIDIGLIEYLTLMLAMLGLCVAYVAISLLLGVFSGKFMVMGIVYGMVVEVGIGQVPMNIRNLAVSHHLDTIYPGALAGETSLFGAWGLGLLACLLIAAFALFAGSLIFSNKQYSIGSGKE